MLEMASFTPARTLHPVLRWGHSLAAVKLGKPAFNPHSGRALSSIAVVRPRPLFQTLSLPLRIPPKARQNQSSASNELNDEQKQAVEALEDCVRVVAGPGSGKTLVLTQRIAYLIKERRVHPSNVLCITFTNKAKEELQHRLNRILGDDVSRTVTIGTFHSICSRILRESVSKEDVGIDKDFIIYDEWDSTRVLKKILKEMTKEGVAGENTKFTEHLNMSSEERGEVSSQRKWNLIAQIAALKGIELKNFVAKQKQSYHLLEVPVPLKSVMPVWKRYQRMLMSYNAVDFNDLIHLTVRMLYRQSSLCQAQYVLVRLLCGENQNLFVVGDVDQAIYGWRGADYRNMLDLKLHFPGLTTFQLRRNYRSSATILKIAAEVMNRSSCPSKSLRPLKLLAMKSSGPPVTFVQCMNAEEEALLVLNKIQVLVEREHAAFGSFGILYRTRNQRQKFEQLFIANEIPYTISGSTALLSYKEIKYLRAYLQLIWNQEDGVSLDHVINTPPRGLGPKTLEKVEQWASNLKISFSQALQKISEEQISHKDLSITLKARNSLLEFCKLQSDLVRLSEEGSVSMLLKEVISRTQIMDYYSRLDTNFEKRAHHIELFQGLAESLEAEHVCGRSALCKFLEAVALNASKDQQDEKENNAVKLSTLHAAKGLEFDFVFIVGVEEGNLPLGGSDLEEERRLCYVGITRARKELVITSRNQTLVPHLGFRQTKPSQFLELPPGLYEKGIVQKACFRIDSCKCQQLVMI